MTKTMNVTLVPIKIDEWLGKHFANLGYLHQEIYQIDMLHRVLVDMDKEFSFEDCTYLLDWMLKDAASHGLPYQFAELVFDTLTLEAYREAVARKNSIVALSLLRAARAEALLIRLVNMSMPTTLTEGVEKIRASYHTQEVSVAMHVGGEVIPSTERSLFALTGEQLLEENPGVDWYFYEFGNVAKYAVQDDMLAAARLLLVKGFAMRDMVKYLMDNTIVDGFELFKNLVRTWESKRHDYLMRQTHAVFISLAGFQNTICATDRRVQHELYNQLVYKRIDARLSLSAS